MKHSLALLSLLIAPFCANAQVITISGSGTSNWNILPGFDPITIEPSSLPEGLTSFAMAAMGAAYGNSPSHNGGVISFATPMVGDLQLLSLRFLRAGTLVGEHTPFEVNQGVDYEYAFAGNWQLDAQVGDNNYIGFGVSNDGDNIYYGYLQFAFYEFQLGGLAMQFIGGGLNSVANEAILIPGVPEPSTWALGAAALCLGAVVLRRRSKVA